MSIEKVYFCAFNFSQSNIISKLLSMNSIIKFSLITTILFLFHFSNAQTDRWQQQAEYKMEIDMDVNTHQFTGKQTIKYYNNSPDELDKVFYHLYFNAFQPGSMMDMRNRSLSDSDRRVKGRIQNLKPNEIGYHKIKSLTLNGAPVKYEIVGTILEVSLDTPIPPESNVTFEMEFDSQVPVQIRRSGRDNAEGISYSMSQWYPKMCEYDYQGWHANPYIGREYYGIWGDFDVKISIDKKFILGGTGYLQNAIEIGYGYEDKGTTVNRPSGEKLTWHFFAPNVHDFVWAADPDYKHTSFKRKDGMVMHFLYQPGEKTNDNWEQLPKVMDAAFGFINENFGQYPYKQYSFIQGGDGGMEYPMATLITGNRRFTSLIGVSIHELMHSWYQMILGTNESLYAWMDEGFTEYATTETEHYLKSNKLMPGKPAEKLHAGTNNGFINFTKTKLEEPLTTHADHFQTNRAYGVAAYVKGHVYLTQLQYIMGKPTFDKAMLDYFEAWKFKHPNANDFIRIMEKASGLELDWYKEYMVHTTFTPDYGIESVKKGKKKSTTVSLKKVGKMPMPLDVVVTFKDGSKEVFNIPLRIMRGEKSAESADQKFTVLEDWPWTNETYELTINEKLKKIVSIEIDPSERMLDGNKADNTYLTEAGTEKGEN